MKVRRFSIRTKLIISFVITVILTGLLVGIQSFCSAKKIIDNNIISTLSALNTLKSKEIISDLTFLTDKVLLRSQDPVLISSIKDFNSVYSDLKTFDRRKIIECSKLLQSYYDKKFSELNSSINYIQRNYVTAPVNLNDRRLDSYILQCDYPVLKNSYISGIMLNANKYDKIYSKYNNYFQSYKDNEKLKDVLLINSSGDIIFTTSLNLDFATNIYSGVWSQTVLSYIFEKARLSGQTVLHDFILYPPSGFDSVMLVAAPIYELGEFMGIIVHTISIDHFTNLINKRYSGENTKGYIVNLNDGFLRSSPFLVSDNDSENPELSSIHSIVHPVLLQTGSVYPLNLMRAGTQNTSYYKGFTGRDVAGAFSLIKFNDLNWGLVIEIDKTDVEKPVNKLIEDMIHIILISLLCVLLFMFMISAAIVRPIKRLKKFVLKVTAGEYSKCTDDASKDEIGELYRAFNEMAQTIDRRSLELVEANKNLKNEIEERKFAEFQLEKEKDFIASIFESQIIFLMVTDTLGNIIKINRRLEDIIDYFHKNLFTIPKNFFMGKDYRFYLEALLSSGVAQYFISELRCKNNEEHTVQWVVSCVHSGQEINYIIWTGVDITEQRKAELKLQENDKMLKMLAASAQDGIIVTNNEYEIISWNDSAKQMFDYAQDTLFAKKIIPTLIPQKYKYLLPVKNSESSTTKGITLEAEGIKRSKELFPIEMSVSNVKVQDIINTLFVIRDNSLRKIKEMELKLAYEKAKVAEKAKTDFLANMSHEIRTPLNGILGFLQLLEKTSLSKRQEDYLKIISSSADSLLSVINEILDFSKIESGKMSIETVEFNSFTVFEDITELFLAKANEKNIDLILDIDPSLPVSLIGDPHRIKQIISNLVGNSIKFTPEGGEIIVSVKKLYIKNTVCSLRIMVTDNGIGISTEQQESIFDAFSQADTSVTRSYGGTGLGLAISSQLASLMNSKLNLVSQLNEGSSFWFDIKLNRGLDTSLPQFNYIKVALIHKKNKLEKTIHSYLKALGCEVFLHERPGEQSIYDGVDLVIIESDFLESTNIRTYLESKDSGVRVCIIKNANEKPRDFNPNEFLFKPVTVNKLISILKSISDKVDSGIQDLYEQKYNGHILVVEDNFVNQRLIKILLDNYGVTMDLADNGELAYNMAISDKYDLILMDIHMPIMDGVTSTKKYLSHCHVRGIKSAPIIALTANVIPEDQDVYRDAGMVGLLAKPIVVNDLVDVLSTYLKPQL